MHKREPATDGCSSAACSARPRRHAPAAAPYAGRIPAGVSSADAEAPSRLENSVPPRHSAGEGASAPRCAAASFCPPCLLHALDSHARCAVRGRKK